MEQEQHVDVAKEPVDLTDDADFMDTGVLHEERICVECGNDTAAQGYRYCSQCLEDGAMEADERAIKKKEESQ
jgi:hypothetical protein